MNLGDFEIYSIVNGTIRLDGGAMFGVVPKVMWQNTTDVDQENRILLATRTLLVIHRGRRRVILVDTGCGTKWTKEKADRFAIEYDPHAIPNALAKVDLSKDDVTDIVISHLHFDHNGGLTDWVDEPGGATRLCYPGARHWIHRGHWDHAHDPFIKDQASFLVEDFSALAETPALHLLEGDSPQPLMDGIGWLITHGHTPYQLHPQIMAGDQRLLFVGDIVPTVAHLRLGWVMAFDVRPLQTILERQEIYSSCLNDGALMAFPHDPVVAAVRIDGDISRPIVAAAVEL